MPQLKAQLEVENSKRRKAHRAPFAFECGNEVVLSSPLHKAPCPLEYFRCYILRSQKYSNKQESCITIQSRVFNSARKSFQPFLTLSLSPPKLQTADEALKRYSQTYPLHVLQRRSTDQGLPPEVDAANKEVRCL